MLFYPILSLLSIFCLNLHYLFDISYSFHIYYYIAIFQTKNKYFNYDKNDFIQPNTRHQSVNDTFNDILLTLRGVWAWIMGISQDRGDYWCIYDFV